MKNLVLAVPTNVTAYALKGDDRAIRLFAESGFDAYDASTGVWLEWENPPYDLPKMDDPAFLEYARKLRAVAGEAGIPCCAAHAPCATVSADPEENEFYFRRIVRSMEAASIVGAKVIVVHPACYLLNASHREELMERNVELYRRLMPYAEKYQIKVAAENLIEWGEGNRLVPGVCGSAEEFCELLDRVDSEWMTVCLDLGHSSCAGVDLPSMIRRLGKERLYMLHVHDNDLKGDQHSLPYLGKIDFDGVIEALREIGFEGIIDLEVDSGRFPEELYPSMIRLVSEVGHYLKKRIGGD